MPRRKLQRKIISPPGFTGYRPFGNQGADRRCIELLYEEYEALRLADYDLMNHREAAALMGISRPTFARIYESARRKIACALVETREIRAVYGNVRMHGEWFFCTGCHARFTMPSEFDAYHCPVCRSENIESVKKTNR